MRQRNLLACGTCGTPVVARRTSDLYHCVLASGGRVEEEGARAWGASVEGLWCPLCEAWLARGRAAGDDLLVLLASGVLRLGPAADTPAGRDRLAAIAAAGAG